MTDTDNPQSWHPRTKAVRGGVMRTPFDETSEALFLTSGYVYPSAEEAAAAFDGSSDHLVYSRYGNPTLNMLETRLAGLEGAEACRACATGMAAIFATLACQLSAGDRLVASRALFGACHAVITKILPRWGVKTELVDGTDMAAWEQALSTPAKVVFLESPSNPLLELVDIKAVSILAHKAGAKLVVDNVFASPLYQAPLELGADIVTYSTTKHIDGQGRMLGGAVLADRAFIEDQFLPFYRQTGAAMSPFNAWVMLKSLETIHVRLDAMSATAAQLADRLAQDKRVAALRYPGHTSHPQFELASRQMSGPGSLIAFSVGSERKTAFAFLNALSLIDISNNLGDAKSLICHPASTTHSNVPSADRAAMGITDGYVRLSVGLENVEDLWADINAGLSSISHATQD